MVSAAFASLVGQPQAVELLSQAIRRDRIAPAYLFVGPDGVGRSLAAQLFLAALLSASGVGDQGRSRLENHPDILRVEPTYQHQGKLMTAATLKEKGIALPKSRPQVRLEQIRDITHFLSQRPMEASRLLVVIEEAQTMGEAAANGLLKTLEEPGHGTLILLATSVETLLPTIVSRCQRIPFYRLSTDHFRIVLQQMGREDLLSHTELIGMAQGSPGHALDDWEKLQTVPPEVLQACLTPPSSAKACLDLARQIDKGLDVESQLWLLDYLQQRYWLYYRHLAFLQPLEAAKKYLTHYVQPQLVWEVTLLNLIQETKRKATD
ncbi:MAG: DNA polymerase III subunit delta' [Thermosynechococcaceae cyanobacterium]